MIKANPPFWAAKKRRTSRLMVRKQMHLPQIHATKIQLGEVVISQTLLQLQHVRVALGLVGRAVRLASQRRAASSGVASSAVKSMT